MTTLALEAALVRTGLTPSEAQQLVAASPYAATELLNQRTKGAEYRRPVSSTGKTLEQTVPLTGLEALVGGGAALTGADVLAATAGEAGAATAAGDTAAGAGAGSAATKASEAAKKAASTAASGLTKAALAGGLAVGVGELGKAYGVRILEIIGGAGLIYFGLLTIAKGGTPPSLPKVVPV